MKKWGTLFLFCIITISISAQVQFGVATSIGGSKILPFRSGQYGSNLFKFSSSLSYSFSFSMIEFFSDKLAISSGCNFYVLQCKYLIINTSPGVESLGRISVPVRLYLMAEQAVGGFFGIENCFNFPLNKSSLSNLVVPFCISPCIGLSLLLKKALLLDLSYFLDLNPYAQYKEGYGLFGAGTRPHYHFSNISLRASYLF